MRKKKIDAIQITLATHKKSNIRSAEITNYLSRLVSYHYKLEVLWELQNIISSKIDPSNIFILSESFKYDHAYRSIQDLPITDNRIYSLLNIGLPISSLPNEQLYRLSHAYKLLNATYDKLPTAIRSKIYRRKWFWDNYRSFLRGKYELTGDRLLLTIQKMLPKKLATSPYENIIKNDAALYRKYISTLEAMKTGARKEKLQLESSKPFMRAMNTLHRPILGIYNKRDRSISIRQLSLIRKGGKSRVFIDLKRLSHESPWEIILIGAGKLFEQFLDAEKGRLEKELAKQQIKAVKKSNLKSDLEIIKTCLDLMENVNNPNNNLPPHYRDTVREMLMLQIEQLSGEIQNRALRVGQTAALSISKTEKVKYLA